MLRQTRRGGILSRVKGHIWPHCWHTVIHLQDKCPFMTYAWDSPHISSIFMLLHVDRVNMRLRHLTMQSHHLNTGQHWLSFPLHWCRPKYWWKLSFLMLHSTGCVSVCATDGSILYSPRCSSTGNLTTSHLVLPKSDRPWPREEQLCYLGPPGPPTGVW